MDDFINIVMGFQNAKFMTLKQGNDIADNLNLIAGNYGLTI